MIIDFYSKQMRRFFLLHFIHFNILALSSHNIQALIDLAKTSRVKKIILIIFSLTTLYFYLELSMCILVFDKAFLYTFYDYIIYISIRLAKLLKCFWDLFHIITHEDSMDSQDSLCSSDPTGHPARPIDEWKFLLVSSHWYAQLKKSI